VNLVGWVYEKEISKVGLDDNFQIFDTDNHIVKVAIATTENENTTRTPTKGVYKSLEQRIYFDTLIINKDEDSIISPTS
jgi:hypothetical protein